MARIAKPENEAWDGMDPPALHFGVPKSLIAEAKRQGAPGFVHGRIRKREFIPWFTEWLKQRVAAMKADGTDQLSKEDLQRLILVERHRELRRMNDVEDGKLVSIAEADAVVKEQADAVQAAWEELPSRLAPDLAGQPIYRIEEILKVALNETRNKLGRKA